MLMAILVISDDYDDYDDDAGDDDDDDHHHHYDQYDQYGTNMIFKQTRTPEIRMPPKLPLNMYKPPLGGRHLTSLSFTRNEGGDNMEMLRYKCSGKIIL